MNDLTKAPNGYIELSNKDLIQNSYFVSVFDNIRLRNSSEYMKRSVELKKNVLEVIEQNFNKETLIVFLTRPYDTHLLDLASQNLDHIGILHPRHECALNKRLNFHPVGKDYPEPGYIFVFKDKDDAMLFQIIKNNI